MKADFAMDWTAAETTHRIDYAEASVPFVGVGRFVAQEDMELITPLPPSPAGELQPLTWIARLGNPKWAPDFPWSFFVALVLTLCTLAVALGLGR